MNEDIDIITTASCYLDGELNETERRAAESDPVVMAEVARMRDVQTTMQFVSVPVDADEIDQRISAAFVAAKSHTGSRPHTDPSTAPSTSNRARSSRSGSSRLLAVAAAVVGVGLVGVVVANSLSQSNQDSSSGAATATSAAAAESAFDQAGDSDSSASMADSTEALSNAAATTVLPAAEMLSDDSTADTQAAAGSAADAGDGAQPDLVGVDELREYTAALLTEVAAAELPLPAVVECSPPDAADGNPLTVVASGTYQDDAHPVAIPIFVAVTIDPTAAPRTFTSFALDQTDCSVIVFTEGILAG